MKISYARMGESAETSEDENSDGGVALLRSLLALEHVSANAIL